MENCSSLRELERIYEIESHVFPCGTHHKYDMIKEKW